MGLFDNIKNFANQVNEVEQNIQTNKKDFLEIYERNEELEKEILLRKQELEEVNQRMLTLQHIWDMMNSSTPLSSVFSTIVKTLQGNFGYMHSAILQIIEEGDNKKIKIISQAEDDITKKADSVLGGESVNLKLSYPNEGILIESLAEKQIKRTTDLRKALRNVLPDMSEDMLMSLLSNPQSRSLFAVPLQTQGKDFGWLTIFSSREDIEDAEKDFLKLFSQQIELAITIADLFQAVRNQAVTDPLTTLYNRRYFEEFMIKEVTRAKRMNQAFTLIALDLDHLKQINDKFGHSIGDAAIKAVSTVLKKNARSIDVAARMGGEEFNLLLPGVDVDGGLIAAERIRAAIEACDVEEVGHITASIGVATFFKHSDDMEELLELADQAMYSAKKNGRNQVKVAKSIADVSWQEVAIDAFTQILSKHKIHISKELSEELSKKLTENSDKKTQMQDMLFSVADDLTQTYNPSHNKGVTKSKIDIATKLAQVFDLSDDEIRNLRIATTLYDIGNLMLPQELLLKSDPLTEDEKHKIQEHPILAAREILKPISKVQDIIPIIEAHHENWDGTGYPGKASGKEIPLSSQIILILDAYFALIEPRSYRGALSEKEALETIQKDSGKKWNEDLVSEFIRIINKK